MYYVFAKKSFMKNYEPRIIRAFTLLDLDLVLNGERNADQGQGGMVSSVDWQRLIWK